MRRVRWVLLGAWVGGLWTLVAAASPGSKRESDAKPLGTRIEYKVRTPWVTLEAKREETEASFQVWLESDVPLDGWLLTRKGVSKPLGRRSLDAAYRVRFVVEEAFSSDLVLTVFPLVDGSPQPLVVPWQDPRAVSLPKEGEEALDPWTHWQADPTRPYNGVVQGLFVSSVRAFQEGRREEAMRLLDKALTLDRTNPQVLDLRERVLAESGSPQLRTRLREAEGLLEAGDAWGALARLDALSPQDAEHPEVVGLRKKAETVLRGQTAPPKTRRAKKARKEPRAPQEDPGAKARADEAYNLGLEAYRKGGWEVAIGFFEQALREDPGHLQARRALERVKAERPSP